MRSGVAGGDGGMQVAQVALGQGEQGGGPD